MSFLFFSNWLIPSTLVHLSFLCYVQLDSIVLVAVQTVFKSFGFQSIFYDHLNIDCVHHASLR